MNSNSQNILQSKNLYDPEAHNLPRFQSLNKNSFDHTYQNQHQKSKDKYLDAHGFYWKRNHFIQTTSSNPHQIFLYPSFQEQLIKQHQTVLKTQLFAFIENVSQKQNQYKMKDQLSYSFSQRQTSQSKEEFLNSLKIHKEFEDHQIEQLQLLLQAKPFNFRVFQIFNLQIPNFYRQKLFYLMFKGFQLAEVLKQKQQFGQSIQIFKFVEQNYQKLNIVPWISKNENEFMRMAKVILYSTIMWVLGKAQNLFYEQTIGKKQYEVMINSRFLNSAKKNNEHQTTSKKIRKIINLRQPPATIKNVDKNRSH